MTMMSDVEQPRATKQLINELAVKFTHPKKADLFGADILTGGKTIIRAPGEIPFFGSANSDMR